MPLRDDLLNPIPGENPSGANLRYAPVYDKIKEARREDDDAPQGEWKHERKGYDWFQFKQSRAVGYEADAAASEAKAEARTAAIAEGKITGEDFDAAFAATPKAFYVESKQNLDDSLETIESLTGVCEAKFGDVA